MDFVSCIGTLMADSGLKEILRTTFGSMDKMLEGKKYPLIIHALRLLSEELLQPLFKKNELSVMGDLETLLQDILAKSKTSKAWIELVIKPTFLIMQFIRATHEPDYALLIPTISSTLPYFFAAQ